MNKLGKTLIALTAGFAAGAAIGILFAPRKGSETRDKISGKSKKFVNSMKDRMDEVGKKVSEMKEKVKGQKEDFAGKTNSVN